MNLQYIKDGSEFILIDRTDIWSPLLGPRGHIRHNEIAVAFDASTGTLHRHGAKSTVEPWAEKQRATLTRAGLHDMANDLTVVSSAHFPIEELNKMLSITGYCRQFALKHELLPTNPNDHKTLTPAPGLSNLETQN